jgi:signal transduction histidine kinase
MISVAGANRRLCAGALAGLLLFAAAPVANAQAQESTSPVQQILVLQSLQRGNLTQDHITNNFRVDVEERAGRPVNIEQVSVGRSGIVGASDQRNVDYIRSIYAGRPAPDLIVTIAGPASVFARKYRKQLFPEVPLIFAASDVLFLGDAPLADNETAVSVINDYPRLIDNILQLLPETRQVFMVTGAGTIGQFWNEELAKEFKRFAGRLTFIESADLTLADILRRSASLPGHSAVVYLAMGSDAQGGSYPDERVLADLHTTANAPMFGAQSSLLGYGIVGGSMLNLDDLSIKIVDASIKILNGESPGRIKVPPQTPGHPIFDWRELQRWRIPESRLPANSVVLFRAPSPWQEYRGAVLTALGVMAVQFLLIFGLLYERRARHRAEFESRKNLALAADASRRATMSALTNSIAHELGQPLGSMIQNAHALQLMVTANRASSDTIDEVLTEIRTQGLHATQIIDRQRTMLRSHQLDKKPTDLHDVIKESLALVAHDMRARQVEATVSLSPEPPMVSGDQVLLQQVLVNLMMNAMDAMSETPPDRRSLKVSTEVRGADVDVSVRDTGTGLRPDVDGQLFTPFVTTKSHGMGIGLTIVQTIVAAHGGAINAHNNPDGGATFTVTLRRGGTPQAVGAA